MKGRIDHEILDLVRFAVQNKFHLRFIEWMPTASEIHGIQKDHFMSSEAAKERVEKFYSLTQDESSPHAPARDFHLEGTASNVGFISPLSNLFCAKCNRLRLKANGMMKTCLHGKEDLDLKTLFREGLSRDFIKERIQSVVFDRPEEHFLNRESVPHNDFVMTAVGG